MWPMILSLGLWTAPATEGSAPDRREPDRRVVYKTIGNEPLSLHVFEPVGHLPSERRPGLVLFFGGGWNQGAPSQFYPHATWFAARGLWVACAEYRTRTKHGVEPPECVKDARSALRFVRARAAELGVDPDRLGAGGGSAGGQLAAATAVCDKLDHADDELAVSPHPNALILFNPVYDNGHEGYGYDRVRDCWRDFSPRHNIRAGMPPTIVFLGDEDRLIPVATAEGFRDEMRAVGARSELHLFPGRGHGFFNWGRGDNADYRRTVRLADEFLLSLGWLPAAPAPLVD